MERRRFGNTAVEVPVIGQGTWYIDRGQRQDAVEALRRGLDLGLTHIDTAEMYGGAEEIVGEAIAGRREEVFLVSKVVPQHASRQGTLQACEQSLARLRTDHLDCYLLHWPGGIPWRRPWARSRTCAEAGKILAWGVSNFDVARPQEALAASARPEPAGSPATRCSTTSRSGPSSTPSSPGASARGWPWWATAPSGTTASPGRRRRGAGCCRRSPRRGGRRPGRWRCASLCAARRCSPSPRPPAWCTWRRTRGPASLQLTEADLARIDAAFPPGPVRRGLPCFKPSR